MHSNIELMGVIRATSRPEKLSIKLTPRGAEVFALILDGISNAHIGERLGIGLSAVRRHREKMLLHNDCVSMSELVAKYYGQIDGNECTKAIT